MVLVAKIVRTVHKQRDALVFTFFSPHVLLDSLIQNRFFKMNRAGKLSIKNLKILVTGSNSRLGTVLTNKLLQDGSHVYTVDKRISNLDLCKHENNHFTQANLADQHFWVDYLKKIERIDSLVNCAAYTSCEYIC